MSYTLLIGGARSGKSASARRMAAASDSPVFVIVTATAGDREMAARIAEHRRTRPAEWVTVEAPIDLADAVRSVPPEAMVLVDCLTLWISNLIGNDHRDDAIAVEATAVADLLARRAGPGVVVTNEVGGGIVPVNDLARRFRDLQGRINIVFADRADRVLLVVAGRTLELP